VKHVTFGHRAPLVVLFALALAHASATPAQETDRYGKRKPACGCYVCGKLVIATFDSGDCAGILAEDACGGPVSELARDERIRFCGKVRRAAGIDSFAESCASLAAYCETSPPAAQPGGPGAGPGAPAPPGTPSPGTPPNGAPPGPASPGGREVFIRPAPGATDRASERNGSASATRAVRLAGATLDLPDVCDGASPATISYRLTGGAPRDVSITAVVSMPGSGGGPARHTERVAAGASSGSFSLRLPKCVSSIPCTASGSLQLGSQRIAIGGRCRGTG
jgi:hypothetical protein